MKSKLDIFFQRVKRIIVLTIKKAMDPYFAGSAAEVAFYLLMSLVPTMILLAQVSNLFGLAMDVIKNLLQDYVSGDIAAAIMPLLDYNPSGAMSIALVLLAFWSGSKALFSLMRITNYAYLGGSRGKNPLAGYIKERLRAILTIFVILFTMVFSVNILIFGKAIVETVLSYLNDYLGGNYNFNEVWLDIRWPLGFLVYLFMVISIYYLLPSSGFSYRHLISKKQKWASVKRIFGAWLANSKKTLGVIFPGSTFAAIGMLIATLVYSTYLNSIATTNFNILYSTLGAAVMLMLWFYILAYVLILGIQLNSIWDKSRSPKGKLDKYKGETDNNE